MECSENDKGKKSSPLFYLVENIPLILIIIFGILITGSVWWGFGILYSGYSIAAMLIFMKFVCPYCVNFNSRFCMSGFNIIAFKLFHPVEGKTYHRQYKHYVPFLYPVWFVPPLAGGAYLLFRQVSWIMIVYLLIFSFTGFVLLPLRAKKQCRHCSNACNRPRMQKK